MENFQVLVVLLVIVGYALFSHRLGQWWISMPAAMVALGYLIGVDGLHILDPSINSSAVRTIAEATLALVLFRDAVRIELGSLRRGFSLPARLLLIGLPLLLVIGTLAAWLLIPAVGLAGAALISTMLAPTDAALGEAVVSDRRLPVAIREGLNIESGLNDGLCVPVFVVLLAVASVETTVHRGALVTEAVRQIGIGAFVGLAIGGLGGLALRWARRRQYVETAWQRIAVLGLALASYIAAAALGGSGFIGAFIAGVAFGSTSKARGAQSTALAGYVGTLLDAVSFLLLGAILLPLTLDLLTPALVGYALLSLVVLRLVSVVVAMIGTGAKLPTLGFIGWFGPRGLASLVFTLLLLETDVPHKEIIGATVGAGVVLSVYLHGFTAQPLSRAYARWFQTQDADHPVAVSDTWSSEHATPMRAEQIKSDAPPS